MGRATQPGAVGNAKALEAIWADAVSGADARARREAVLAEDPRSDEEVASELADLDALVRELTARLEALLLAEAEAQVISDDELVDVDPDLVEIAADDAGGGAAEHAGQALGPPPVAPARKARKVRKVAANDATKAAGLLYEDVLWLLGINDGDGAMISLERLLVMGKATGELEEFLELNQEKLLNLYQTPRYLGPFDAVPKRVKPAEGTDMHLAFREAPRVAAILGKVTGKASIQKIIKQSAMTPLETCCILGQLRRSGLIEL